MRKALAGLLVLAVGFAGCGSDDDGGGGGGEGGTQKLRVATFPFAASAPLYIGDKKGFFREEGLDIEPQLLTSGPQAVTTVVSGQNPVGFSSTVPLIVAASRGLPVKMIAPGELAGAGPKQAGSAVLVSKDSPIRAPSDLEGKTIAVVALKDIGDVTIKAALEKKGVDVSKLKFVEIPFPDMPAALEKGRVDAIWTVEPFTSLARSQGARVMTYNYVETRPNLTIAAYFSTERYIDENRDTVDRFVRAMNRSLEYAQSHPEEVRAILPTYTQIPPEAAKVIVLPTWERDLNRPALQQLVDLSKKYGLTEEDVSLEDLILPGTDGS